MRLDFFLRAAHRRYGVLAASAIGAGGDAIQPSNRWRRCRPPLGSAQVSASLANFRFSICYVKLRHFSHQPDF